mgnify:CR=1 FL=1
MPVIWDADKPSGDPGQQSAGGVIWDAEPLGEDRALTQAQIPAQPTREAYSAVAEPVTQAVDWAARRTPMATLAQYLTGTPDATMDTGSRQAAELLVPQTPTGAGAALGHAAASAARSAAS